MPHPQLKHSPIVEAVCEVRFAPEAAWDWTVPGRLAARLGDEYPVMHELVGEVLIFGDKATAPPPSPERIQLKTADQLAMVQSGPRLLAVNQLSPYPGWEAFVERVSKAVDSQIAVSGWQPLQRIGLLYINRIETSEEASEVLSVYPRVEELPDSVALSGFVQRWDLAFDSSTIALTTTRVKEPIEGYVIQLDAYTHDQRWLGSKEQFLEWLELAHDRVYEVFSASITPRTMERLRG